ncbi:MAG: alpha/beta hydrolase [Rhodospirillales bacterium]|nr:alpha/beta hydrolase [Rhodospirillales bacterium]
MKQTINALDIWVERGESGSPTLLLCHGAGCTGGVWDGLVEILEQHWPGGWVIPDLRGHGRSDHAADYSVGHHAADMASLLRDAGEVVVCGHSMGGLIALALASASYGVNVTHAISIGAKLSFTDEERAQMIKLSETPTRWFDTRDEAIDRFLRVSGLTGLVDPGSDVAATGIVAENGRFRLAADMATARVAISAFTGELYEAAKAHTKTMLAAGSNDTMVPIPNLRDLDPDAVELTGLGHNAHVEDPDAVWKLITGTIGKNHG